MHALPPAGRSPRAPRFTLIELLMVMAIIAILMGILFPAISGIKEAAKRNKAKSELAAIVLGVKNYEATYGSLPWDGLKDSGAGPAIDKVNVEIEVHADANGEIVGAAANGYTGIDYANFLDVMTGVNSRQTIFLDPRPGGGLYLDPWERNYIVMLDLDYDNEINVPVDTLESKTEKYDHTDILKGNVLAYSRGNPDKTKAHVFSWIE